MIAWLCGVVLGLSVLLGGGTHKGFLGDVIVQILSVPLLTISLWLALKPAGANRNEKKIILVPGCAALLVIGIQLFPLPFDPWSGGAYFASGSLELPMLLAEKTWTAVSLSPQATCAAAVSLMVPAAIFSTVVQLDFRQRLNLTWLLLILGALDLLLGFAQMAQGPASPLRFYAVTNPTEPVGFFANRNHFAAHLYLTLVLAAVLFQRTAKLVLDPRALNSRAILWLTAAAVFLISVVAGLAMARSRAGVFLAMVALGGILFMLMRRRRPAELGGRRGFTSGHASALTILFAVLFAVQFGLGGILSRFQTDAADDLRWPLAETTFVTALESLPFGTGLGTFVPVYATVEKTENVSVAFANRAHNDFAEILLETGIPGAILVTAFLVWFARHAYAVWSAPNSEERDSELLLPRAAALIIVLLLTHSLVDYPLRTTALSVIFAFFCAILAVPAPAPSNESRRQRRPLREVRTARAKLPVENWGTDIQWPESWQKSS